MEKEEEEQAEEQDKLVEDQLSKLRIQIKEEQANNDKERRKNEGDSAKLAKRTEEL